MSRKEEVSKEIPELNLGPIMNMVVILIPLLLLSVVFTEVGVINITAPKMAMGPSTEAPPENQEEPVNLTVSIDEMGLRIIAKNQQIPPVAGCPTGEGAVTVCLQDQTANVTQAFADAVANLKGDDVQKKTGTEEMKKTVNLYNWRELYNQLSILKDKYPDETVINVSAVPTMPYSAIVRLMDVSRYKLEKKSYEDDVSFWQANYAKDGESYAGLFPDPVLNLAK